MLLLYSSSMEIIVWYRIATTMRGRERGHPWNDWSAASFIFFCSKIWQDKHNMSTL